MKKSLLLLIAICGLCFLNGCGGASGPPPPPVIPATHFSVAPATATPTSGKAFMITVTALGASGQMATSYSGTLHFTSSDAKAVLPADTAMTGVSGTFSVTLNTAGSQSITATDGASLSGSSGALTVGAVVATQFSVTPTTLTATAGTAFSITVTAQDGSNNAVTSYSGTVHFTSSDPQAVLPANATLTNGTGIFSITLKTANGETVTATDTSMASITGTSSGINVASGTATHLIVTAPATASAGPVINFGVTAQDIYGNVATNYAGIVHISTNDAQAAPPANTTLTGGIGNFSITLKTIQSTTITATDTVTASITGTSSPITVTSNAVTHLSLNYPIDATTRAPFQISVTALDVANNQSLTYTGTLKFTSSDSQAHLPANPTLASGFGNFSTIFETAGPQTITVTDTVTASLTATSSAITVTAASAPSITSGAPPNGTFGVNYGPSTAERFLCVLSGFPYERVVCTTPCDSSNSNCAGYSACRRYYPSYPCVTTKTVFGGFTFAAKGGLPPYSWSATGLPPGLSVVATTGSGIIGGEIIGTPTSAGTFNISVTVTDGGNPPVASPASNYTIVIKDPPPPVINATPAPPTGAVNLPYSFTFTAASPATPFTWRVSVGTLPAGLTLNPDGLLSGTPTTIGTASITVIATDELKQDSAPQVFSIQIFAHGFKATGSMATARRFHTATLLGNGKVLVAGGEDAGSTAFASAELYDPSTGMFSPTGSMTAPRTGHTATLLSNGKVLITGGATDATENALASAELYDPVAGTFTATTGMMTTARVSHTATLLKDGRVLVAGGDGIFFNGVPNTIILSLASAEIFDPSKGTFTATGTMSAARETHTATLLTSGKVLVAGGSDGAVGNPTPAVTIYAIAELFDPSTGQFTAAGMMTNDRDFFTASLLSSGKVLAAGGLSSTAGFLDTAELFDPSSASFAPTGNMMATRFYHDASVLNDGTVLLTGGSGVDRAIATAEVYDPTTGMFASTGSMLSARVWHTSTLLPNGKVLVTGGADNNSILVATAELYQ
jgi:hypothetical protein